MSSAYYYWIYFPGRTAPFLAYPAKFDLSALPDKTVSYFISDQLPGKLVDGDNYDALVRGSSAPAGGRNLERRQGPRIFACVSAASKRWVRRRKQLEEST